jgi:hypothetical protein
MIEFARPEFLWALPAAAIPWIIDLLNRRRYRRVRWAAMDYVMQAEQHKRRRIRFQHLLLLLLRTLAVLLVVLLFAQPRAARALPGMAGAAGARLVVVLDDSASTAQIEGQGTAFDRAKAFALSLAGRTAGAGSGLTVYLSGRADALFTAEPLRPADPGRLRQALEPLQPSADGFDMGWLASLGARAAGPRAGETRFFVVTDLRAADWGRDDVAPAARRALSALQQRGPVVLVDVGADPGPNAGITDVLWTGRFAYARAAVALRLIVQNYGPDALPAGTVSVSADGGVLPSVPAPAVPAGGRAEAPVEVFLDAPGGHYVQASLQGSDTFTPDDVRFYALDAAEQVPVLIVEGAPGSAFYLKTALQPLPDAKTGLRPEVVSAGADLPPDLAAYAAVFLCDLSSPAPWRDVLVRYVRGGGRLVAFLGERADADAWNSALFAETGGLPVCRVAGAAQPGRQSPGRIKRMDFADLLLRPFSDWQALLSAPAFWEYRVLDALGGARAPLRFDDAGSSPALLVADAGPGLVAVLPFGANDAWTDWPRSELGRVAYLALVQWLVESGEPAGPALNLEGGSPIRYRLDPSVYRSEASLLPPGGGRAEPVVLRALPQEGVDGLWFVSDPLRRPGIWELRLERTDGGRRSVFYAVNVPVAERQLAKARAPVLLGVAAGPGRLDVVRYEGPSAPEPAASAAYWRAVAGLALLVLVAEGLLAFLFGNPARSRAEPARRRP